MSSYSLCLPCMESTWLNQISELMCAVLQYYFIYHCYCWKNSNHIHTYIHTYFIGSSPRGFSESMLPPCYIVKDFATLTRARKIIWLICLTQLLCRFLHVFLWKSQNCEHQKYLWNVIAFQGKNPIRHKKSKPQMATVISLWYLLRFVCMFWTLLLLVTTQSTFLKFFRCS